MDIENNILQNVLKSISFSGFEQKSCELEQSQCDQWCLILYLINYYRHILFLNNINHYQTKNSCYILLYCVYIYI